MKRLISIFIVFIALTLPMGNCVASEQTEATRTRSAIFVNNKNISMKAYNIFDNNYFKLRDIAYYLKDTHAKFDVSWNEQNNQIEISRGKSYQDGMEKTTNQADTFDAKVAYKTNSAILIDGKPVNLTAYNVENNNYFKLRELGDLLGFKVEWDEKNNGIYIYDEYGYGGVVEISDQIYVDQFIGRYNPSPYDSTVSHILNDNGDGTCTVIGCDKKRIVTPIGENAVSYSYENTTVFADKYNVNSLECIEQKQIPLELPIFGGVYFGSEYNFVVSGQNNPNEDNDITTIRVTKYDKEWNKIKSADYKDNNTVEPFNAGSLRMVEYNGYLYIRTCHKMYMFGDGLNHQSNLAFSVDIDAMNVVDRMSGKLEEELGYVSHSFSQFTAVDNGKLIGLDLGDASPRAILLGRYNNSLDNGKFANGVYGVYDSVELIHIPGADGDNATGVMIGDFEIGENNYITAVHINDYDKITPTDYPEEDYYDLRDVVLFITNKDDIHTDSKMVYLTDYTNEMKFADKPYMIPIGNDRFVVMWHAFQIDKDWNDEYLGTQYVLIDENGNTLSEVQNVFGQMFCEPILIGNKIHWYAENKHGRVFYSIAVPNAK